MRTLCPILALTLAICACSGVTSTGVPPAQDAQARAPAPAASGNPWLFFAVDSNDPHIGAYEVLAYAPAAQYANPATITKDLRSVAQLATDSVGNLFVLDYPHASVSFTPTAIHIFAPPYTGAPRTLGIKNVGPFALDDSNDLFVPKREEMNILRPPYETISTKFTIPKFGGSFALDSQGDVFAAVEGGVNEYSPPSYALRATTSLSPKCGASVEGVSKVDRVFVVTYCKRGGYSLTAYRAVGKRLKSVHPPLKICSPGSAAIASSGEFFISTYCGVLQISPLFVTVRKLNAFGKVSGPLAVSGGGQLYVGGSILLISQPPYNTFVQKIPGGPYNAISSIALGP